MKSKVEYTYKVKNLEIKNVELCTGDKVFHVTHENFLEYGEGKTIPEALEDFHKRVKYKL